MISLTPKTVNSHIKNGVAKGLYGMNYKNIFYIECDWNAKMQDAIIVEFEPLSVYIGQIELVGNSLNIQENIQKIKTGNAELITYGKYINGIFENGILKGKITEEPALLTKVGNTIKMEYLGISKNINI